MKKFSLFIAVLMGLIFLLSCEKEVSCEGCRENKPPIAIAKPGHVITLPTESILLDGSAFNDPGIHTLHVCEAGRTQGQKIAQNILDKVKFLKD